MAGQSGRLEVSISPAQRGPLDALAKDLGISSSGIAKLGISWVLARHKVFANGGDAGGKFYASNFHAGLWEDVIAGAMSDAVAAELAAPKSSAPRE